MTPVLDTPRLTLRPVAAADAPAIQKHFANWNIVRRLSKSVPWPYPPDGAERFLRDVVLPAVERGEAHVWGLVPKEGPDEVIGLVDYRARQGPKGQRGFWLAEAYQGRGLMTEAVTAVQDHLFFELGVERLLVTNARANVASRRVKEKTGARLLGTVSIEHHEGGSESELWEITRGAWARFRG